MPDEDEPQKKKLLESAPLTESAPETLDRHEYMGPPGNPKGSRYDSTSHAAGERRKRMWMLLGALAVLALIVIALTR